MTFFRSLAAAVQNYPLAEPNNRISKDETFVSCVYGLPDGSATCSQAQMGGVRTDQWRHPSLYSKSILAHGLRNSLAKGRLTQSISQTRQSRRANLFHSYK